MASFVRLVWNDTVFLNSFKLLKIIIKSPVISKRTILDRKCHLVYLHVLSFIKEKLSVFVIILNMIYLNTRQKKSTMKVLHKKNNGSII